MGLRIRLLDSLAGGIDVDLGLDSGSGSSNGCVPSINSDVSVVRDVSSVSPSILSVVDKDVASSTVSDKSDNSSDVFENSQDVHVSDALNVSESDMEINPDVPTVRDMAGRDVLKKEILADDSLRTCRDLANKELNGYKWSDGVLIHSITEKDNYPVDRIVLPTTRRCQAPKLAHDKTAHVGVRGTRKLIGRRFTWPGLH